MSDNLTERMLNMAAGLTRDEPAEAFASPDADAVSADVPSDTAGSDADEHQTLDEAFAALDGQGTPQDAAAEQPAEGEAEEAPLSPEETIAALQAEVEKFRAEEAQRELAQADISFEQNLEAKIARYEDMYEDFEDVLWRIAKSQGNLSDDEIELKIYRYLYEGKMGEIKHLDQYGRATGQTLIPKNQWLRQLPIARDAERAQYYATKSKPSVIDQVTQTYNLTDEDRQKLTTLATKLTPEELADVAALFASKNQNVTSTLQNVTKQARQNVAANLSNGIAPGSPGAPPPKKPYKFTGDPRLRHDETMLVAKRLGIG